ncbi:MAG: electron transporter SenC [Gemmatimonadota bacterium]|nr:MAG: electron transporter SenC [Gemmatimonadota bacterium]
MDLHPRGGVIAWLLLSLIAGPASAGDAPKCCDAAVHDTSGLPTGPVSGLSLYQLGDPWTDQENHRRTLADWRGQPILLVMMFTHCEYACPRIVQDLRQLRARLEDEGLVVPHIVMASFDIERDQPERLRTYAAATELAPEEWTLLHGEEAAVRGLAAALGIRYRQDEDGQFAHSNVITLLNAEGEIAHQLSGLEQENDPLVRAVRELSE